MASVLRVLEPVMRTRAQRLDVREANLSLCYSVQSSPLTEVLDPVGYDVLGQLRLDVLEVGALVGQDQQHGRALAQRQFHHGAAVELQDSRRQTGQSEPSP